MASIYWPPTHLLRLPRRRLHLIRTLFWLDERASGD
jgi:hypothetical protein